MRQFATPAPFTPAPFRPFWFCQPPKQFSQGKDRIVCANSSKDVLYKLHFCLGGFFLAQFPLRELRHSPSEPPPESGHLRRQKGRDGSGTTGTLDDFLSDDGCREWMSLQIAAEAVFWSDQFLISKNFQSRLGSNALSGLHTPPGVPQGLWARNPQNVRTESPEPRDMGRNHRNSAILSQITWLSGASNVRNSRSFPA